MGFVEIIRKLKTKSVSLPKISILVQIVGEILPQLCSNDCIQILLKMAWFLTSGTKPIKKNSVGSSEYNQGNISSPIGDKVLNFGMETFYTLFFLHITTKLVIILQVSFS